MAISLVKGQRVQLGKDNPGLQKIGVGLGWDTNESPGGHDFDLDASVFMLGSNGKILSDHHFIFYNNTDSPDGAVHHTGDNLTGEGDGDDELVNIDLSKVDAGVAELLFVVTIHDADERKQNFGQVRNSFIRIFNQVNDEEILMYELDEDFSIETAITFGRLYKKQNEWRFEASGVGKTGGLQAYLNDYS